MVYDFQQDGEIGADVLRIAVTQLARLEKLLRDAREPATGHHRTRKCLKRLRALLILVRSDIGLRRWRKADRELAEIGRALSGARDHAVILTVLNRVAGERATAAVHAAAGDVRKALRGEADGNLTAGLDQRDSLQVTAAKVRERINAWPLARLSLAGVLASTADTYRDGRQALKAAYRHDTAEAFHDLRKQLQRHGRHMQLLQTFAPQEIQLRIDVSKVLSDLLGEDHDLSLLRTAMTELPGPVQQTGIAELDGLCSGRQQAVRRRARPLLRRLYAEKPQALARRLKAYWKAGPLVVTPPAPTPEPAHLPPARTH
jgi:CHAD domain-containing protein